MLSSPLTGEVVKVAFKKRIDLSGQVRVQIAITANGYHRESIGASNRSSQDGHFST